MNKDALKGSKKLWNYFLEITKKDPFNNEIKKIRKKYKIPQNGYKFGQHHKIDQMYYDDDPKLWPLDKEINKICKKYNLSSFWWNAIVMMYVLYNTTTKPINDSEVYGLCTVVSSKNKDEITDDCFPVAIKISPYASKRDILDYVTKNYHWIKFFQGVYKDPNIKIGKFKSKSDKKQKRNDFIYEHKNLPLRKITRLVNDKFNDDMDYGNVGKIISLEKKRRKEL